jgi:4-diphosphocytidyl-2-C-methyl-D-erythritol kinase
VAIGRGRGERLEPVSGVSPLDAVIVRPPAGLSTPAVYRACQIPARPESVAPLVAAWQRGDYCQLAGRMTNRLEAPAEALSAWIGRLSAAFAEQGCWAFQMSGSGSSYFGIARHAAHARRVAERLRARRLGHVICTRTIAGRAAANGGVIAA